jgi:glycosyltransferase involved in cell wall biosynthesis
MNIHDQKDRRSDFSISLVVPMYNEEAVCDQFFARTIPILEGITPDYEIICINDGSHDNTLTLLKNFRAGNDRIKVVNLTRNFGKEAALTAGINYAGGDCVVPLDSDLQDPPELIPELVARWSEGYDVALAVRTDRSSDSFGKRLTASLFYRFMQRISDISIPSNTGDFRLMDRKVVEALKSLPERTRFMKGLFAWLGFTQIAVPYVRPPRTAGTTKWHYWKLWNFALEGIFSFTTLPLRVWTYIGLGASFFGLAYMSIIIFRTLFFGVDVPGYASLLVTILFFSGLQMIGMGILGEYLGRVFIESKQRPLYLVYDTLGIEESRSKERLVSHKSEGDAVQ